MATMVKEKRREKKKSKEKASKIEPQAEVPSITNKPESVCEKDVRILETESTNIVESTSDLQVSNTPDAEQIQECKENPSQTDEMAPSSSETVPEVIPVPPDKSMNLDTMAVEIQDLQHSVSNLECAQDSEKTYLSDVSLGSEANESIREVSYSEASLENATPSAPVLEDEVPHVIPIKEIPVVNEVIRLKSMPFEDAVKQFGVVEMSEVMVMSEREEAIVEAGPSSGPEHPLVDLLSTLRRSLIAVERERTQMEIGYAEEEKFRSTLWRVTKKSVNGTEKCSCGLNVYFKATYDHAELQKDRLPVARLKLEGLLKDVQECFCHNQHEALLAHYQIEEFISEVVKSHKGEIREALALVLQALKRCDSSPAALAGALERWARALAAALLDQRDLRQLLFLIHHLFRQTRSVRWAARIISVNVTDSVSAARAVALLDLLFTRTKVDAAIECVEDREEAWEEVDKDGGGGAVSDGSLRERDLLALLAALPMRTLVATILRLHPEAGQSRSYRWEDTDARGIIRACCGARVLLHTLTRAILAHATYTRLQQALRGIARNTLNALAALHEHARPTYSPELESKVFSELQAVFLSGVPILESELYELPASLLAVHTARDYCLVNMKAVEQHGEESTHIVESLPLELARASCSVRVRVIARAAARRKADYELARLVADFLFQVGVRKCSPTAPCKGACRQAARESIGEVLAAHPYLHAFALHLVAETNTVEKLDASSIECLCIGKWRPQCGEIRVVLDAWAQRCSHLLPALLMQLDTAPHLGVSLESQLTIGAWLCDYGSSLPNGPEEWCWTSLRRLRLHQTYWGLAVEAPPVQGDTSTALAKAYALAYSDWGHSIPLICSEGVEALCALAAVRVQDALHCLSAIMLVLAHSPESVYTTARFGDLFSIFLTTGPGLVQRALGRGGASGADCLLRLMMEQLKHEYCGGVSREALAGVWLAALWRVPNACGLLDAALLTVPRAVLDRHCTGLARMQDEESQQQLISATKWSAQAPLLCCAALVSWHTERESRPRLFPKLLDALHGQRAKALRIHVDNALKSLGASFSSDQLAIYGVASATLTVPPSHPASLSLWRFLMHLYLQRPTHSAVDSTPPVGPLFFSGLIKSRTLTQVKRRILKFIQHHAAEATALKSRQNKTDRQSRSTSKSKTVIDNHLTSPLCLRDLTGESSESSDIDTDNSEEQKDDSDFEESAEGETDVAQLLVYHIGAERMFCEYIRWLDEGEKTKAMPHHAEIANFIPEQALQASFQHYAAMSRAALSPEAEPPALPPSSAPRPALTPPTPLQEATQAITSIKHKNKYRSRRRSIRSPLEDVNVKDPRALLAVVDKHLSDIEKLSQEWCKEVNRVSTLDASLWDLVTSLRVPQHIPVLYAACANKCPPIQHATQERQWCISTGAEQGIVENRRSARAAVRHLARSRPHAARAAALLLAVARRCGSLETARRMAERVFQCAGTVSKNCAPAAAALASLVDLIADRWLLGEGAVCAALVSRFGGARSSPLQRTLCLSLVAPGRCSRDHLPSLHAALLASHLPAAEMFSALSKFELGRWSKSVESGTRGAMLESLVAAAQRWGPTPSTEDLLLVELLGVQMSSVCQATELCALVCACNRACVCKALSPHILTHLLRAAERCAPEIPFDQLGHVLRELGVIWWEARTTVPESDSTRYDVYAHHIVQLLLTLHRSFYDAAVALSYAPEKVSMLCWASLQESLAAWIAPFAPPALPPPLHSHYTDVLRTVLRHIVQYYSGIKEILLNHVFEWVIQTYQLVRSSNHEQGRVQMSSLLECCAELPWSDNQWLLPSGLQALLQVSQYDDEEMLSWCAKCCERLNGDTWVRGEGPPAVRLAALLHLWTGTTMPCIPQTVETACQLPWSRLPEIALDEALDRFFQLNYGLATPYHHLPQFRVLLSACELTPVNGTISSTTGSRQKRARGVSQWTRALLAHRTPRVDGMTETLAQLAPYLVRVEGGQLELVELVGRALAIFCIESAAAAALPVWEQLTQSCEPVMARAILQAVGGLTVFESFATLADVAVRRHLATGTLQFYQVWEQLTQSCEPVMARAILQAVGGLTVFESFATLADVAVRRHLATDGDWSSVVFAWQSCVWSDPAPLCARARLHAAYATHARTNDHTSLRTALLALLAADIDFKKNEAIVGVWICASCRVALRCGSDGEEAECKSAALGLLGRWGDAPRGLLRLVMSTASGPTQGHRLLCQLAQCVLYPNNESFARAYESSCATVLSSSPDVATWGRKPHPKRLPRLAMRLYPSEDKYFKHELDLAPEDR